MKTAIYVEDGVMQIVLTPVTAFEKEVVEKISHEEITQIRVCKGTFHRCKQGWATFEGGDTASLMLQLDGQRDGVAAALEEELPEEDHFLNGKDRFH